MALTNADSMKKQIRILNLCESAPASLYDVLESFDAIIIERGDVENIAQLDFIIVDSLEQAEEAARDFKTVGNNIKLVCLSAIREKRKFLLDNGRLMISSEFCQTELGRSILTRFFGENNYLGLSEDFENVFKNSQSFRVVNHLNLGSSIDETALDAFEQGFNIVALRSFLDHALFYFTYLKQAGLAGIPFEVERASSSKFFGVRIHAPVKNFAAEYLLDSFGTVNSQDPILYLLGVAAASSDFMEITHIEKPARLIISGYWSKDKLAAIGGVSFNNVLTTAQIAERAETKIKAYQPAAQKAKLREGKAEELKTYGLPGGLLALALNTPANSVLADKPEEAAKLMAFIIGRYEEVFPEKSLESATEEDLKTVIDLYPDQEIVKGLEHEDIQAALERVRKKNVMDVYSRELERARKRLEGNQSYKKTLTENFAKEVAKRVAGSLEAEALNRVVKGSRDPEELRRLIKEAREDENCVQIIKGGFESVLPEFKTIVSGNEDFGKGGLFDFASMAVSSLSIPGLGKRQGEFFQKNASTKIAAALETYALSNGLAVKELTEEDLLKFSNDTLPQAVQEALGDETWLKEFEQDAEDAQFEARLREKLLAKLEQSDQAQTKDGHYYFSKEAFEQSRDLVESAMQEAMEEEFRFVKGTRDEIEAKEKEIVSQFSSAFEKENDEMARIIRGGVDLAKEEETQRVVAELFQEKPGEFESVVVNEYNAKLEEDDSERPAVSMEETNLLEKLKQAQEEIRSLKNRALALEVSANAQRDADNAVKESRARAAQEARLEAEKEEDHELRMATEELEETQKFLGEQLRVGKPLEEKELAKIEEALNRERQLLARATESSSRLKLLEIESKKQESLLRGEAYRALKKLKAKETLIEKIKSSSGNLVERQREQLAEMRRQNEELNQRLKDDRSVKLEAELAKIKKELESATKVAQMYKSKVENMLQNKSNNGQVELGKQAEEMRTLSRLNIQLENQLNAQLRDRKHLEGQLANLKEQEGKFRARATGSEAQNKSLMGELTKLKALNAQLQSSLKDAGRANSQNLGARQGASSVKEKRLEQNVKKLNSELSKARGDLVESKKQIMKLRSETVALKNKIKELKKNSGAGKKAA